jgi:hypothetical protein
VTRAVEAFGEVEEQSDARAVDARRPRPASIDTAETGGNSRFRILTAAGRRVVGPCPSGFTPSRVRVEQHPHNGRITIARTIRTQAGPGQSDCLRPGPHSSVHTPSMQGGRSSAFSDYARRSAALSQTWATGRTTGTGTATPPVARCGVSAHPWRSADRESPFQVLTGDAFSPPGLRVKRAEYADPNRDDNGEW